MTSWWLDQKPEGFTKVACAALNVEVRVDDVSDREMAVMVKRSQVLSAIEAIRQAKTSHGLRHANVVSKN